LLVGYAHDMDMDSAGRVLLPPMLRKFAELDKNVVLVGQGSKVELWNEARWEAQVSQALSFRDDALPPELEGFTL
jgi:MraZ protein